MLKLLSISTCSGIFNSLLNVFVVVLSVQLGPSVANIIMNYIDKKINIGILILITFTLVGTQRQLDRYLCKLHKLITLISVHSLH